MVAEIPTKSSPIQHGEEGKFYLEMTGLQMLRGKKVMSPKALFCLENMKGKNGTCKFLLSPYLKLKNLVVGTE
jgi:hypothetical protein